MLLPKALSLRTHGAGTAEGGPVGVGCGGTVRRSPTPGLTATPLPLGEGFAGAINRSPAIIIFYREALAVS